MNSSNDAMADEELDLDVYLKIFWKRRGLILGLTFAATFLAGLVSLTLPKTYRAEAILLVGQLPPSERLIEPMVNVMARINDPQLAAAIRTNLHLSEQTGLSGISNAIDVKQLESRQGVGVQSSPDLLRIGCTWTDTQTPVQMLQFVADAVIAAHAEFYKAGTQTLQTQIHALNIQLANNRDQQDRLRLRISQATKQLEVNADYQDQIKYGLGSLSKESEDTQGELARLNKNSVTPVDILYLNSTYNAQSGRLMDLNREKFSLDSDDIKRNQELVSMEAGQGDLSNQNESLKVSLAQLKEQAELLDL